MKILAVGNMYPPHHAGGYELAWQAAMRHARRIGHDVRVVASDYRNGGGVAEEDPDVHRTLRWYWDPQRYEFPRLSFAQRLATERRNAFELARHLHEFQPDVVSWWSMGCMSLSLIEQVRRAGVPAALVVHDDWLAYGPRHDAWIRIWRGRRRALGPVAERLFGVPVSVDPAASGPLVFNSRYTADRARAAGVRVDAARVVHPGIEQRFLEPLEARPWGWRLACIGRIDRQKGLDVAVAALAKLPAEAVLDVWGSGSERYLDEVRALAARLGVAGRVRFRGFARGDALRDAYAAADAIVFPVRWDEPFGLVPLEAMGLGRPLVATARGGTAEFVRDGENALVFASEDAAALAACVRRLAQDEGLRARVREQGLKTAAQYTQSRFAELTVREITAAAGVR